MPRLHRSPRALCGAIVALLLSAAPATAQTYTWNGSGTDALWSNPNNWTSTDFGAPPTGSTVVLTGSTQLSNTLDYNFGPASLTFNAGAGAFVVGGTGTLTVGAGGITQQSANNQAFNANLTIGAAQTWTNSGAGVLSLGGTVTGGGNLLTLAGTGGISSCGGTLSLGTGGLTITNTGTVNLGERGHSHRRDDHHQQRRQRFVHGQRDGQPWGKLAHRHRDPQQHLQRHHLRHRRVDQERDRHCDPERGQHLLGCDHDQCRNTPIRHLRLRRRSRGKRDGQQRRDRIGWVRRSISPSSTELTSPPAASSRWAPIAATTSTLVRNRLLRGSPGSHRHVHLFWYDADTSRDQRSPHIHARRRRRNTHGE